MASDNEISNMLPLAMAKLDRDQCLAEIARLCTGIDQIQLTAVKWAVSFGGDTPMAIIASKLRELVEETIKAGFISKEEK